MTPTAAEDAIAASGHALQRRGVGPSDYDALGALPWSRFDVFAASLTLNFLALALSIVILQIYDRILANNSLDTLLLLITGVGAVIQPGQELMEIVPSEPGLVVEARISTRDVGHVEVGQPAKIKADTYDFARYGAIQGVLERISATTFQNEEGRPYYKGTIRLERDYVGNVPGHCPVLSGMTVQAAIVTGRPWPINS